MMVEIRQSTAMPMTVITLDENFEGELCCILPWRRTVKGPAVLSPCWAWLPCQPPVLRDCKNCETNIIALLTGFSANAGLLLFFSETAGKQRSKKIYFRQVQQEMFRWSFVQLRPHAWATNCCQVSKWHHLWHEGLLQTGHIGTGPFCWTPAKKGC